MAEDRSKRILIQIKGGKPWGFSICGGETKSHIIIHTIEPGGKAFLQGKLKVGDQLVSVNSVNCYCLRDALEFIEASFNTLTLSVLRHGCSMTEIRHKDTSKQDDPARSIFIPYFHKHINLSNSETYPSASAFVKDEHFLPLKDSLHFPQFQKITIDSLVIPKNILENSTSQSSIPKPQEVIHTKCEQDRFPLSGSIAVPTSQNLQNPNRKLCILIPKSSSSVLEEKPQSKDGEKTVESTQNHTSKIVQTFSQKNTRETSKLPPTSSYFTTSVPKAKLLNQLHNSTHLPREKSVKELARTKVDLVHRISSKLEVLKIEQTNLLEEVKQNDELGINLAVELKEIAMPEVTKKFNTHADELDKITRLLLSLSGRIAKTKNALLNLTSKSSEEKSLLEANLSKLNSQYGEALHLKTDIDRRTDVVLEYLHKYLPEEKFADYEHFIKMKVRLLVDYKELVEKINLGEEQLDALKNSIIPSERKSIKRM